MFETLTKGFRAARNRLSGVTELTEDNIDQALRDVRMSLLEADVEFGVVKRFLARVREDALGRVVQTKAEHGGRKVRVGPAEQFIKICEDELVRMMAFEGPPLEFAAKGQPTGVMLVGLQGSGKTTTAAKLAGLLEREYDRKPLLVAADVQRPGAIEQLEVLGERLEIPVFSIPGGRPIDICTKAQAQARHLKRDTIIYDTAGRLAVDEPLMEELDEIKKSVKPHNVLLVVDAMIGQDSVKTAQAFHERLDLGGVVLTKLDGDARGGAALSVREVTGAPVKFVGLGEALDRIETFRPDGMASRILGMGDVVGLMKDFEGVVDEERAEQDAQRMLQGQFTLEDFLEQIGMLQQMGPLQDVFEKLPGFGDSMPEGFNLDEGELDKTKALVSSMTKEERRVPEVFQKQPNRLRRVARGSGRDEKDVAELLQRFMFMRQFMGDIGQQAGMLQKLPGMKQMATAKRLKDAVQTGGLEHNPMMANLADQLLEAAVAGGQGAGPGAERSSSRRKPMDKGKKKQLRKMKRKSKRKSRK
ncbi:MAG: signal recognition particle protein [Myxococcota bacterium]